MSGDGQPDFERLRGQIENALRNASDQQIVRVMDFVERLKSRTMVEDLIASVRDRIAVLRPARPMTVPRLLVLPVEDLLVPSAEAARSAWLIPRPLLGVVHRIVLGAIPQDVQAGFEAAARGRTMDDRGAVLDIGQTLWPRGAAALQAFLEDGAGGEHLTRWEEAWRRPLGAFAEILEHAADITFFLDQLPPRPMGTLREDERTISLALLYAMRTASDVLFRSCLTMLIRRSGEPAEIFALVAENDFEIPPEQRERILSEVTQECLREIETINDAVDGFDGQSVHAAAETTARLVSLIESLQTAPAHARPNPKALAETRAKASRSIVRTFERSVEGPVRHSIETLASTSAATDAAVAGAEEMARSVRKIEIAGGRLGLELALAGILHREYDHCRKLIREKHRRTFGTPEMKLAATMDELRLVEILFGPDDAERLMAELQARYRG